MATLMVGCLAGATLLALCGLVLVRYLLADPESVRARKLITRRGIVWRTDALSACHRGLIVSFAAESDRTYCTRCGDPIGDRYCPEFWARFRDEVAPGSGRSAEDAAWELRDAIRVLREEIAERQGTPLSHSASMRR
ncbi:MAG: hypothetical protein AAB974_02215 [Patescibacteria group bacterium]